MVKKIVTEILEEDFRKLDITVYKHEWVEVDGHKSLHYVPHKLNDLLDEDIKHILNSGYESDLSDLSLPVTIAIHEDNYGDSDPKEGLHGYFDKFMNQYSGITTYYIGWGIAHLYSTRDYYEAHEDYWRVSKKETKVIYRVKLDEHWLKEFVLKHKTEVVDWPYDKLPEGIKPDYIDAKLEIHYDLINDEFVEVARSGVFKYGKMLSIIPVDKEGNYIKPDWDR